MVSARLFVIALVVGSTILMTSSFAHAGKPVVRINYADNVARLENLTKSHVIAIVEKTFVPRDISKKSKSSRLRIVLEQWQEVDLGPVEGCHNRSCTYFYRVIKSAKVN